MCIGVTWVLTAARYTGSRCRGKPVLPWIGRLGGVKLLRARVGGGRKEIAGEIALIFCNETIFEPEQMAGECGAKSQWWRESVLRKREGD